MLHQNAVPEQRGLAISTLSQECGFVWTNVCDILIFEKPVYPFLPQQMAFHRKSEIFFHQNGTSK